APGPCLGRPPGGHASGGRKALRADPGHPRGGVDRRDRGRVPLDPPGDRRSHAPAPGDRPGDAGTGPAGPGDRGSALGPESPGRAGDPAVAGAREMSGPGRNQRGMTLLEVLIAVTITAVIAVLLVTSLRVGVRAWETGERRAAGHQEVRAVIELLT